MKVLCWENYSVERMDQRLAVEMELQVVAQMGAALAEY